MPLAGGDGFLDRLAVAQHLSRDDLQEPHPHVQLGSFALDEPLGAHDAAVVGVPRAVARGEHAAEGAAPLVLQRGAAIRPQQVALVEDRVGDAPHRVHGYRSPASSASTAASQVGSARRDL